MRTWICAALALTACSPEIGTGAYLCGDEGSCPEGQLCNGADNTCVIPSTATTFACDPLGETNEPDQDAAHAATIGPFNCVSQPVIVAGCLANNDKDDWYTFATNPGCVSQAITANLSAPIAFETVTLELYDSAGTTKLATAADTCTGIPSPDQSGTNTVCLAQMLAPGTTYTLRITPTGQGNCGGSCAFNRYRLSAQTVLHD